MACVPAPSLIRLREEVDSAAPGRNKASDGMCPSAAHTKQNPNSLHETGSAIDITHDPGAGADGAAIVAAIVARKPTGIVQEVIFNRQIWTSRNDWAPRPYSGKNPHESHVHVGVTSLGRAWGGQWLPKSARGGALPRITPGDDGGVTLGSQIGLGLDLAGGAVTGAVDAVTGPIKALGGILKFLSDGKNWLRLAMFIGGLALAGAGIAVLLGDFAADELPGVVEERLK